MEVENKSQEQQLNAVQRAKRKYYLKNKDKLQKSTTEWNKNAYINNLEYREMVKKCSNNYYHTHREEIRAKVKAKKLLTQ